ncbi:MAG: hypothetical protein ABSA05_03040 [Opitutaceae bacterium]|jgi:hypothetical protein
MAHNIPRLDGTVRIRAQLHEVNGRRGKTWFFSYNLRGRRIRSLRFKDREKALFEIRKLEDQYEAKTPYQATTLTREQLDDAQGAFLTLRDNRIGKTLGEIASWYVAKGPRCVPITIAEATKTFLSAINNNLLRTRTIKDYRLRLGQLAKSSLGPRQMSELTSEDFRKYLQKPSWGTISQWHQRQAANRLYRWAMTQTPPLATENPLETLPKMTKRGLRKVLRSPAVVTPADTKAWLRAAAESPHLPFIVLSFFAGMRRNEIEELAKLPQGGWEQINLGAANIRIPPTVGKEGKRLVTMGPMLIEWLKWLKRHKRTRFVAPNLNKGLRAIKRRIFPPSKDGTPHRLAKEGNLARHSYISYSLRLPGASFAAVAMNAGTSEEVIKDHYNDLQVTPNQAAQYWSLTPKTLNLSGNC